VLLPRNLNISLKEYQQSDGISLADQIVLLKQNKYCQHLNNSINSNLKGNDYVSKVLNNKVKLTIPKDGGAIFCGNKWKSIDTLFYVKQLMELIKLNDKNYKIYLGKGDYEIDDDFCRSIPKNVTHIWANNINSRDSRLKYMPLGRDFRSSQYFNIKPSHIKRTMLYCNFSINTNQIRSRLNKEMANHKFAKIEHMGAFLKYPISRHEYYERLCQSKFVLCPRGRALDTYRMWDCMYLGAIPIVIKEAVFHDYLSDMPILFIKNIRELKRLSRSCLQSIYKKMLNSRYNYGKLYLNYWL